MLKITPNKLHAADNIANEQQKLTVTKPNFALSAKAQNLVKKCSLYIEDVWTDIKQNGIYKYSYPEFHTADSKNLDFVTVKPIYQNYKDLLYIEIESEKYADRIMIDRKKPNHYTYEHAVRTPHGSAALKTFNSQKERDKEIEHKVSKYIEKYLPDIIPLSYRLDTEKAYFTKKELL